MVKLVHDQRQVHALHPGMISPSFPQAVGAIVPYKPNFLAYGMDEHPGLATLDAYSICIGFGVEKNVMLRIVINTRIGVDVFNESLPNTIIYHNFLALTPFLLFDPKAPSDYPIVIHKMTYPQLKQV